MDVTPGISAVAALEEPSRRRLYEYVCTHEDPVGRDEVSEAVGMPRQTVAFHLDKLADAGLLAVEFARRGGRAGPGAGRPSKLYRRSDDPVSVQLPERSYELAGQLLAQAVDDAESTGESPRTILNRRACELGQALGADAGSTDEGVMAVLAGCGYEPRRDGTDIVLVNCPFHALAARHTDLVCGMNLGLVEGLLDGAHCTGRQARLTPHERYCCVRIEPAR
jgi:predicted ArsR family transcriptional regulator